MKKNYLGLLLIAAATFTACGDSNNKAGTTSGDAATNHSTNNANTTMDDTMNTNMGTNAATAMSNTPLEGMDKTFAMKAAMGGMMEVEAANIAMQNSTNERVKSFASMMIRDHGKSNSELKSIVSAKGMTIPEDSLMKTHKTHLDAMRKMKGKAFDQHYMNMMLNDHNKDINEFQKASTSAKDADVKAFATKNLPILRMHKDSAQAMAKMKM